MDLIERTAELREELKQHGGRLKARANEIMQMASSAPETEKHMLSLISQSFTEQVDTALEFLGETVEIVQIAIAQQDEEDPIGLEPEESEQLLGTLTAFRGMLDEIIASLPAEQIAQKAILQAKLDDCLKSIALVEELTLPPEDDEGDDEDDDAEEN